MMGDAHARMKQHIRPKQQQGLGGGRGGQRTFFKLDRLRGDGVGLAIAWCACVCSESVIRTGGVHMVTNMKSASRIDFLI
jgi:hypothetical protein